MLGHVNATTSHYTIFLQWTLLFPNGAIRYYIVEISSNDGSVNRSLMAQNTNISIDSLPPAMIFTIQVCGFTIACGDNFTVTTATTGGESYNGIVLLGYMPPVNCMCYHGAVPLTYVYCEKMDHVSETCLYLIYILLVLHIRIENDCLISYLSSLVFTVQYICVCICMDLSPLDPLCSTT